jgi:hypothetical protein
MTDNKKILVDARALGQLLHALDGKGHLIRELQATRIFADNPISTLWSQYQTGLKEPVKEEPVPPAATPPNRWRANGEPDPHDNHYDCERAQLTMGSLTDDELANAVFMNYDVRPNFQDIIDGKAFMPIAYVTAAKERIRWLSRKLHAATQPTEPA